jgi:FkbM family methyltransferase
MIDHRPGYRDRVLDFCGRRLRWLPKGRTTCFRLLRHLLGNPERAIGTVDGQLFSIDMSDETISVTTYLWDMWEAPVTALGVSLLQKGMCVVDVGANKGYFSLLAARRVLPGGRVISYEPHPRNLEDIEITIRANNYHHWIVRPFALSAQCGTASFFTPGWEEGVSGWGSLDGRTGGPSIEVITTTLAIDLKTLGIEQVDLLKMDVQGHELEALQGAIPLLQRGAVHMLLIEVHLKALGQDKWERIFEIFDRAGYTPFLLREDALSTAQWRRIKDDPATFPQMLLRPIRAEELQSFPPSARPYILWRWSGSSPKTE